MSPRLVGGIGLATDPPGAIHIESYWELEVGKVHNPDPNKTRLIIAGQLVELAPFLVVRKSSPLEWERWCRNAFAEQTGRPATDAIVDAQPDCHYYVIATD